MQYMCLPNFRWNTKEKAHALYSVKSRILQLKRLFCITDWAGVQPIYRMAKPIPTYSEQTAMHSPGPPSNGFHNRNPWLYIRRYTWQRQGLLLI